MLMATMEMEENWKFSVGRLKSVVKRNGETENFDVRKILIRLIRCFEGFHGAKSTNSNFSFPHRRRRSKTETPPQEDSSTTTGGGTKNGEEVEKVLLEEENEERRENKDEFGGEGKLMYCDYSWRRITEEEEKLDVLDDVSDLVEFLENKTNKSSDGGVRGCEKKEEEEKEKGEGGGGTKNMIEEDEELYRDWEMLNDYFKDCWIHPCRIALQCMVGLYDGVSTALLDELLIETCAYQQQNHPEFCLLAGRLSVTRLWKTTPSVFSECISQLYSYRSCFGESLQLIADDVYEFIQKNAQRLDKAICQSRDLIFDYFGFKTLERSYFLRIGNACAERPQFMLMRVACGIHKDDVVAAIETYNLMSQRYFIHATPTLFYSGTKKPQLASCFLMQMKEDSIPGIFESIKRAATVSAGGGGLGIATHNIRSKGSYVKGNNGKANGLLPMLRVLNDTSRYVDQGGGKRKGAFAVYLEPWHADVMDFVEIRKNSGKEENRARDLFCGMWIPDLFMRRVERDEKWTLMDPYDCPHLNDCWGDAFNRLYEFYEKEGLGRRTISARELWKALVITQIETGTPYLLFKDACNAKSNQRHMGCIQCSNLCTEIIEFTAPDEIAVCNLASICLPQFVKKTKLGKRCPKKRPTNDQEKEEEEEEEERTSFRIDEEEGEAFVIYEEKIVKSPTFSSYDDNSNKRDMHGSEENTTTRKNQLFTRTNHENPSAVMEEEEEEEKKVWIKYAFDFWLFDFVVRRIVRNLNKIIDGNLYPLKEAEVSNLRHRPIGIGVQGLADCFAKMRLPYDSEVARTLNIRIFERMYFAALSESSRLAEEKGKYESYAGSPTSEGLLQFDLWKRYYEQSMLNGSVCISSSSSVSSVNSSSVSSSAFSPVFVSKMFDSPPQPLEDFLSSPPLSHSCAFSSSSSEFHSSSSSSSCSSFLSLDWEKLKQQIRRHGLRNSLLTAPMPTSSTAQILGNSEGFEPYTSNLYRRSVLAGDFVVVNSHLVEDLISHGLWTAKVKEQLVALGGSIQHIPEIPNHLKELYRTVWEIKQKVLIDRAAERGVFVDQSQSMNLYLKCPNYSQVSSMLFYAWRKQLKTGLYYLRTRPSVDAVKVTVSCEATRSVFSLSPLLLKSPETVASPECSLAHLSSRQPKLRLEDTEENGEGGGGGRMGKLSGSSGCERSAAVVGESDSSNSKSSSTTCYDDDDDGSNSSNYNPHNCDGRSCVSCLRKSQRWVSSATSDVSSPTSTIESSSTPCRIRRDEGEWENVDDDCVKRGKETNNDGGGGKENSCWWKGREDVDLNAEYHPCGLPVCGRDWREREYEEKKGTADEVRKVSSCCCIRNLGERERDFLERSGSDGDIGIKGERNSKYEMREETIGEGGKMRTRIGGRECQSSGRRRSFRRRGRTSISDDDMDVCLMCTS